LKLFTKENQEKIKQIENASETNKDPIIHVLIWNKGRRSCLKRSITPITVATQLKVILMLITVLYFNLIFLFSIKTTKRN